MEEKSEAYRRATEELERQKGKSEKPEQPPIEDEQSLKPNTGPVKISELSAAGMRQLRELVGTEKILALKDRIYNSSREELAKDPEKLKYWTLSIFILLEEMRKTNEGDFKILFDQAEAAILDIEQKPESSSNDISGLLRNNTYAREALISFYSKNFGEDRAVKLGEDILAKHPEDPLVKVELGIRYTQGNRKAEGRKLLEEAVQSTLEGTISGAMRLAALYAKGDDKNQLTKAINLMERATVVTPEDVSAQLQLIKLYRRAGRIDEAMALQGKIQEARPDIQNIKGQAVSQRDKKREERRNAKTDVIKSDAEIANIKKTLRPVSLDRSSMEDIPEGEAFEDKILTLEEVFKGPDHSDAENLRRWVDSIFYHYYELAEDDPNRELLIEIFRNVETAINAKLGQKVADAYKPFKYNIHARIKLAFNYSTSGQHEQAIELSKETLALAPQDVAAKIQLAQCCWHAKGRKNKERGIAILEAMVENSEEANFRAGSVLMSCYWQSGRREKAIELGQEMVSKHPENLFASTQLVKFYREKGDPMALKLAEQTNKIHPEDAPAAMQLARFYFEDGKHQEAIATLEKCLKINPSNLHLQSRIARIYWDMGRKEEAMERAEKMLSKDYSAAKIISMTRLYWDNGEKDRAVRILKEAVEGTGQFAELNPLKLNPYNRLMLLDQLVAFQWYSEHKPEAMELARSNYEQYKDQVSAHVRLANLYIKGFEFDPAKRIIESLNLPGERRTQDYLWIKYYYSKPGQSKEVINRCLSYIQSEASDFADPRYRRYLPIVMTYFYKTQPNHPAWNMLETLPGNWFREVLGLGPKENIKNHFAALAKEKGDFDKFVDRAEVGQRLTEATSLYEGPYLIPINRGAKQGVTDYGFGYREQGTKIVVEKQKPGKVKYIDPNKLKKPPK